jgi:hypothetical protein
MRRGPTSGRGVLATLLTVLMMVQLFAPMGGEFNSQTEALDDSTKASEALPNAMSFGHDLAGQNLDIEGMSNLVVRQDSSIDNWMTELLHDNASTNLSEPDMYLAEDGTVYLCWMDSTGSVFMGKRNSSGEFTSSLIDTVSTSSGLIGCSIAVDESERPRSVYADGDDLKMARLAFKGQIYTVSDIWLKRTIVEGIEPVSIDLALTPDGQEFAVVRNASGVLWQVNNSGMRWYHSILDTGPVGDELELKIDSTGVVNIAYTRSQEAVRLQIDGSEVTTQILARGAEVHTALGLDLDGNDLAQVATTTFSNGVTELSIFKSLEDKSTGRISTTPSSVYELYPDVEEGTILSVDINADGFDDVIMAQPSASSNGLTSNGRVVTVFGSATGLDTGNAHVMAGAQNAEHFGSDIAVGDFKANGNSQLVIGSSGFDNTSRPAESNHGRIAMYEWSSASQSDYDLIWNASAGHEEMLGASLSVIDSMYGNSHSDLVALQSNWTDGVESNGRLSVFAGTPSGFVWESNITESTDGPYFGRSMSSGGDLNGDGYGDFVVSNTGSESSPTGYSAIEVFYGSAFGFSSTSNNEIQVLSQGRMFGTVVEIIDDINNDGMDELILQELAPLGGALLSGKVHLFHGGSMENFTSTADWTSEGSMNQRLGWMFESVGDINDDGYMDTMIGSSSGFTPSGLLELYLGSANGLQSTSEVIQTGGQSQHLGSITVGNFDSNADGTIELLYTVRNQSRGTNYGVDVVVVSKQDFDTSTFSFDGEMSELRLSTADRGETAMVFALDKNQANGKQLLIHLEHVGDGSPGGSWVSEQMLESHISSIQFESSASGKPYLLYYDTGLEGELVNSQISDLSGFLFRTSTAWTALHQDIRTLSEFGTNPASAVDANGDLHVVYSHATISKLYYSTEDASKPDGWSGDELGTANLTTSPSLWFEGSDMHILTRDSELDRIQHIVKTQSGFLTSTILASGLAVGDEVVTTQLWNGTSMLATTVNNSDVFELQVLNINAGSSETLVDFTDGDSEISMCSAPDGDLIVASIDSSHFFRVHERNNSSMEWRNVTQEEIGSGHLSQLNGSPDLSCTIHGDSLYIALRGLEHPLYERQSTLDGGNNSWIYSVDNAMNNLVASDNGSWDLVSTDSGLLLFTSTPGTETLRINTMNPVNDTLSTKNDVIEWSTHEMKNVYTNENFSSLVDSNGTIILSYFDTLDEDVDMLRLYLDSDRDLIFDSLDALPHTGDQWMDNDSDGFGDNLNGPLSDECPSENGPSEYFIQGCVDYDNDGFADSIDACPINTGRSIHDRYGCPDYDEDGWSNNDGTWVYGDRYQQNWKQVKDSDGDGVGDNYGPDCCDAIFGLAGNIEASPGDKFPFNPRQYKDYDNDGYGDNETDSITGDFCPYNYGTSYRDRNGCEDSDGDGASDPSNVGGINWETADGADLWVNDPTQWADSDGDGYGDNGTIGATNPDSFPNNYAAAEDNDSDGYPDRWTDLWNEANRTGDDDGDNVINTEDYCGDSDLSDTIGMNGCNTNLALRNQSSNNPVAFNGGLVLDGCPNVFGTSTDPLPGCPDSDLDGWANTDDDFPLDPTQFLDYDGDGFGDNISGNNADACPFQYGVSGGTDGDGCPLVNTDDSDGDGVYNDLDDCENTPLGSVVDATGCSNDQLDDDEDGVSNSVDLCADTASGATVDTDGCSSEQLTQDTDGDGIVDPEDQCPDSTGTDIDAFGCDEFQRDTDGDGVVDNDDDCPDTQAGYPVDSVGCLDEDQLDQDLDNDGYSGNYTFTIDSETGLRIDQTGDAFPLDGTQWFDQDGDGFGDNLNGNNADFCPEEFGTSYLDSLEIGCFDDGDGWADNWGRDKFPGDATQWNDSDGDGYGDNWNNPDWNISRDSDWPGEFILDALVPDKCPDSPTSSVDDEGCSKSERDTDGDGVNDLLDNCPEDAKGNDGYEDGCPLPKQSGSDKETTVFGMSIIAFSGLFAGLIVVVIIVGLVLRKLGNRGYDYDDEDDEDDFMDDDDSSFSSGNESRSAPVSSLPSRGSPQSTSPPSSSGPSRGPPGAKTGPSRGPPGSSGPSRGPPGAKTGPSRGPPGAKTGPSRGPPGGAPSGPKRTSQPVSVGKKPLGTTFGESSQPAEEKPQKKVRKARIEVDMSLFEDWQVDDREAAVDWVEAGLGDGEQERTILMQLQETGWTAQQSRAIFDMARNR